jgi:hypothetical protein
LETAPAGEALPRSPGAGVLTGHGEAPAIGLRVRRDSCQRPRDDQLPGPCRQTGTLTFAPGETTKTITVWVNGDSKKEADETFYLDLFGNSSNSLLTKKRGLGTILNDD